MDLSKGMLKNWLDKAKNKMNEISSNDESPRKIDRRSLNIDESYFQFELEGGPKHSDLLIANAKVRSGPNEGDPLPLSCKWFISDASNDMKPLEEVTSAFFQPTIDDVGAKILVQAVPVIENYVGMPVCAEIGPLVLDSEIEKRALSIMETKDFEIKVRIEAIFFDYDRSLFNLPCEGVLAFTQEKKELTVYAESKQNNNEKISCCKFGDTYPNIILLRKHNNMFELHLSPIEMIKFSASNHFERDSIAIIIRMFLTQLEIQGKEEQLKRTESIEDSSKEDTSIKTNLELLMKFQQVSKDAKRLNKENKTLKEALDHEKEQTKIKDEEIQELKQKLEKLSSNYETVSKELETMKLEQEKYLNEKLFYLQDLKLFKAQVAELEALVASYQQDDRITLAIQAEREKVSQEYDNLITETKIRATDLEVENEQIRNEMNNLRKDLEINASEKEELHGQINSLKNKIKSLQAENEKFLALKHTSPSDTPNILKTSKMSSPPLSHKSSECESEIPTIISARMFSFEDPAKEREKIQTLEEENRSLRDQVKTLTQSLEILKLTMESDKKGKKIGLFGFGGSKKNDNPQGIEYLQKLVGTLTETIGEKEIALEHQKEINKSLGKRITELEEQLLSLQKD